MDGAGGIGTAFLVAFGVVAALVLLGFVLVGWAMVRTARAARRRGLDPFLPEAVLLADALQDGPRTLEQRVAALDDLHQQGVVSDEEHRTARARLLGGG